jgi:hypothetical protein
MKTINSVLSILVRVTGFIIFSILMMMNMGCAQKLPVYSYDESSSLVAHQSVAQRKQMLALQNSQYEVSIAEASKPAP